MKAEECSDADWAGDHDNRKSTKSASSWRSKKQDCIAAEAGYVALSSATQAAVWLTADLGDPPKEPTTITSRLL